MIPFGPLVPDLPDTDGLRIANNVVPAASSYRPLRALAAYSDALGARCQGAFASRGTVANFAGDVTKLYTLSSAAWSDVTRAVGGDYATPTDGMWRFAQFGSLVIATNGVDAIQKWTLGTSSAFDALGGSPPTAEHVAVVRDFVVLGNTGNDASELKWSGINDGEDWTASQATQSDAQILPDGGEIMGVVGGEYGVALQQNAVRRMTYVGTPLVFQFDKVEDARGVLAAGSVASFGPKMCFYLGPDDFYVTDGNGPSQGIGSNKIAKTFFNELSQSYLYRITAAIDPINKLYCLAYPSSTGTQGQLNRLALYNWELGKWSFADLDCEYLFNFLSEATTLEGLVTAGYTNLDTLPFSLDSRVWQGGAVSLAAFDTGHKTALFTGSNLEATFETGEAQLFPGQRALVTEVAPYIDGGTPTIAVGTRENAQSVVSYGAAVAVNAQGRAMQRASGKYHRAQLVQPAGSTWNHASGVEFKAIPAGTR